ncbi:hypothetical protein D9619_008335 [Psilocybe cf. subviscida]|uniref:Uncharacterized protein n=1 Tax=Psilocybe cf. subviscida TaxID=2480587 RepID=A0A8H5BAG1_9AGAR|nr:hypothetical protein D9619_008335 [Psilocybe cf. subviscida]
MEVYVGATAAAKTYLNGEFPGTETGAGVDVGIDMGVGMCGATTKLFVFFFFDLGHHLFRFSTLFSVPLLADAIEQRVRTYMDFGSVLLFYHISALFRSPPLTRTTLL